MRISLCPTSNTHVYTHLDSSSSVALQRRRNFVDLRVQWLAGAVEVEMVVVVESRLEWKQKRIGKGHWN